MSRVAFVAIVLIFASCGEGAKKSVKAASEGYGDLPKVWDVVTGDDNLALVRSIIEHLMDGLAPLEQPVKVKENWVLKPAGHGIGLPIYRVLYDAIFEHRHRTMKCYIEVGRREPGMWYYISDGPYCELQISD